MRPTLLFLRYIDLLTALDDNSELVIHQAKKLMDEARKEAATLGKEELLAKKVSQQLQPRKCGVPTKQIA